MKSKILPIIVIYHCQLPESRAYTSFIKKNGLTDFVVYDNSPAEYCQAPGNIPSTAYYFHDSNNGGLSKAYNYGAAIAEANGYDWILLLDQDTYFPDNAYEVYRQALKSDKMLAPSVVLENGAAFSPCRSEWLGMKALRLPLGTYSLYDICVINSGCCITLALFKKAGGYKETVKLDFSDYQFQRRLRKVSEQFDLINVELVQDFSNDEQDAAKLFLRFCFYLEGALQCDSETFSEKLKRHLQVLKHTVALTVRTKKLQFFKLYVKKYI